ncbi:MAG: MotA/TolQ/ExbB proton channel family protein [Alphaproteobacteria bacterium]|nr:MAG: MotA/TolQ/ExbB proton channel family protein [Alphaproteobacteria bacterium]
MPSDLASGIAMPDWFRQLGLMGWPLALCSVIAIMVVLERLVFMIRAGLGASRQYGRLAASLEAHRALAKPIRDELAALMLAEMKGSYYSGLKLLRLIGTISPLLGLLGTIFGIIAAFQVIAAHSGPVSPAMIADGLWEAMLTTAAGLMIALPALLMAHFFAAFSDRQLEGFCLRLNRLSLSFEAGMEKRAPEIVDFTAGARRP